MFLTIVPSCWDIAPRYYEQRLQIDTLLHSLAWMQAVIPMLRSGYFKAMFSIPDEENFRETVTYYILSV